MGSEEKSMEEETRENGEGTGRILYESKYWFGQGVLTEMVGRCSRCPNIHPKIFILVIFREEVDRSMSSISRRI